MKPYYDDGTCTIYHGDCREVRLDWVPVLITDPPYERSEARDVLFAMVGDGNYETAAIFGYPEALVSWCVAAQATPDEWVTWWPTNKPETRARSILPRSSEHIAIFGVTPGAGILNRPRTTAGAAIATRWGRSEIARENDVWRDPAPGVMFNARLRQHPNEKPVSLMTKLVQLCSTPEQVILDPFMGSGTTLRAAKDLGRHAIGIEIEERYCEIAARRLGQEVLAFDG
jgi:hypothetical protein